MVRSADTNRTVLTPQVIRAALDRLAEMLNEQDVPARIAVYGGASLALTCFEHDRTATADVGGTYQPVDLVEDAAKDVGVEMGLADGWLNNRMRMFLPPVTLDDSIATAMQPSSP